MPQFASPSSLVSTRSGDLVLEAVLVVTLRDGTPGFATTTAALDRIESDPQVTLVEVATGRRTAGTARVVRSGASFEEVCGRTRLARGLPDRWRHRGEDAVVLVEPEGGRD